MVLATNSKRVKVVFRSQKECRGDNILLRFPEDKGGPGNPSAPIHVNTFRTTNIRSSSAMRGAEIHGNKRRDGTTRILSIRRLIIPSGLKISNGPRSGVLIKGDEPLDYLDQLPNLFLEI